MKLSISVQNATKFSVPSLLELRRWVGITFQCIPVTIDNGLSELTIRFIDQNESATLNKIYRNQRGPTNILSFFYGTIPGFPEDLIGDLAICSPLVFQEAKTQKKFLQAHFAHLVVHGVLHLLGYNHVKMQEALEMETLEIAVLSQFGYKNPYKD
ncbi:rRNA maturation RNase YbeY [Coxiella endosymbiont of Amblyomma americanum]|uniref:rRNA maturation RNase YbeY n=1 Tax=Coxiella endosymbiont of Amblyomma americanum TaxID=325775 RepID=UPI00057F8ACA|nr:rRNA maturation factor [Coxiella endosymbiont of Amblyomma americanum]